MVKELLHVKFLPRYNDKFWIQHADDQIEDGSGTRGEPHEGKRVPIGGAIESYQAYATVEVFKEQGRLEGGAFEAGHYEDDTDAVFVPSETDQGLELLYSERPMEKLKTVTWTPILRGLVHLVFRFRAVLGSATYKDVDFYVYVAIHEACGELGAGTD